MLNIILPSLILLLSISFASSKLLAEDESAILNERFTEKENVVSKSLRQKLEAMKDDEKLDVLVAYRTASSINHKTEPAEFGRAIFDEDGNIAVGVEINGSKKNTK